MPSKPLFAKCSRSRGKYSVGLKYLWKYITATVGPLFTTLAQIPIYYMYLLPKSINMTKVSISCLDKPCTSPKRLFRTKNISVNLCLYKYYNNMMITITGIRKLWVSWHCPSITTLNAFSLSGVLSFYLLQFSSQNYCIDDWNMQPSHWNGT